MGVGCAFFLMQWFSTCFVLGHIVPNLLQLPYPRLLCLIVTNMLIKNDF